jgi:hypothetical protein
MPPFCRNARSKLLHANGFDRAFVNTLTAVDAFITYLGLAIVHRDGVNRADFNAILASGACPFVYNCRHFSFSF